MVKKTAGTTPLLNPPIFDWLNLPQGTNAIFLWDCLHDAQIVSIRSNLLERTVVLFCDIEHLRSFHGLPEGWQFILKFDGVQSARVARFAIWPGKFAVPADVPREEESRLVAEYQAKWREESLTWTDFESMITRQDEQLFEVSDATLATSTDGIVAIQLQGQLNYATRHVVSLRAEHLIISGSDGKQLEIDEFRSLGMAYWEDFSRRAIRANESRS
jgi:hypothetical protein